MAPKSTIFRLRGIPDSIEADQVRTLLSASLLASGEADKSQLQCIGRIDVVPSGDSGGTSCALVEWKGENDGFLSDLSRHSQEEYGVEVAGDDWMFDRHFLGFTQLYQTEINQPITAE